MLKEITVRTLSHATLEDITDRINRVIAESGVRSGICHVFVPHTTAGITINEDADPSVAHDILHELDKVIPWRNGYEHGEGNAAAHIKASLLGASATILIDNGRLRLGTWQGVYLAEFDGPRQRRVWVKVIPDREAG